MNLKIIMIIIFFMLSNSVYSLGVGGAEGNMVEFRLKTGKDSLGNNQILLIVAIDTYSNYTTQSGVSTLGSFSFRDRSGVCPAMPNMRAALDVSDMGNDIGKKIMYSMLMSAYLLKRPVKLTFSGCKEISGYSAYANIDQVNIINR